MERINKLIKLGSLLAFFVTVFAVGFAFSQITGYQINYKAYNFLPFNKDKAQVKAEADNAVKAKMLFVGDMMLDRHVGEKIKAKGFDYLFEGLKKDNFDLNSYDLINANLEGAMTDNGNYYPPNLDFDFAFSPAIAEDLKSYNFNIFNLANNHLRDQGERGITETGKNLDKLDIKYYGCADALVGDCSFKIYKVNNLDIGFVGLSMVYKKFDLEKAKKMINDLKNKTDLIIVNIHWGVEYSHTFNKIQSGIAYELVDAGVDIIIGHHPHVVQGMEIYQGKPIFYSLGNFIFDQYFSAATQEELVVEIEFKPDGQAVARLMPLLSKQSQPNLMVGEEKNKFLENIASWSKGDKELLEQIKTGEIKINF